MLQYILTENDRWTVGELAQMAVEGGCLWISLHLPDKTDAEIRDLVEPDVIELCRESSVFLTIDDRPELARELGLHGVRLSKNFFLNHPDMTPVGLREELGPEAVIGLELVDPTSLRSLVAADLDFLTVPSTLSEETRRRYIDVVKSSSNPIPVVIEGNLGIDEALGAIVDGFSGIALGSPVSDSADPVATMQMYIDSLNSI